MSYFMVETGMQERIKPVQEKYWRRIMLDLCDADVADGMRRQIPDQYFLL